MAVATALVVWAIAADGGTTPLPDLRGRTSELYATSVYSSSSSCVVSNINVIKTLTLLVHAGIFWRFHNPKNSDMDYMIFILSMWSFYMHRHTGNLDLLSHPKDFCAVCTEFDRGEISRRAQSLARNGHPSIWWPRSTVFYRGFRERASTLALRHWLSSRVW